MTCKDCIKIRRDFFIENGLNLVSANTLDTHLIVSWYWSETIQRDCHSVELDKWQRLITNASRLSKKMSGIKAKPYIRVLAIGELGCPHLHFILSDATATKVKKICTKLWGKKVEVNLIKIFSVQNLLGYFFDQNFIPTVNHPDKIKGVRLLTASRPMLCGFPPKKLREKLKEQPEAEPGMANENLTGNGKESCLPNGASI